MPKPSKFIALTLALTFLTVGSAFGGVMPSKTSANQSIADRQADLATVNTVLANDQVSAALAAQGLTRDEVNQKLASLSNQELNSLAENIQQVQAAGLSRDQWIWIGVGALAVLLLLALT